MAIGPPWLEVPPVVHYKILIKRSTIASHVHFSNRPNVGRLKTTCWKDLISMKYAEGNSRFLGNDYPEDGGCKLRQHIDSSTRYHVTEDLNLHDHNYGISNLARCKQHTVFFFFT